VKNFLGFLSIILMVVTEIDSSNAQWAQSNGITGSVVNCIAVRPSSSPGATTIFAGTYTGVFISQDNDSTWKATGLTAISVLCFALKGSYVFAGSEQKGLFLSTDDGVNWSSVDKGLADSVVFCIIVDDTNLFVGTRNAGIFRSTNNGASWDSVNSGLTCRSIYSLAGNESELFAGTPEGVFSSTDKGQTWTDINAGSPGTTVTAVTLNGSRLFAQVSNVGICVFDITNKTWTICNYGKPDFFTQTLVTAEGNVFAGAIDGLYKCAGDDTVWTKVSSAIHGDLYSFAVNGSYYYAGIEGRVQISPDSGASWSSGGSATNFAAIQCLAVKDSEIFAGSAGGGVLMSKNSGKDWYAMNSGLTESNVLALAVTSCGLFAGTGSGVFLSTNDGANWKPVNNGLSNTSVRSLAVKDSKLFAGTTYGIFVTTDSGATWNHADSGLTDKGGYGLIAAGKYLFKESRDSIGMIAFSTDDGLSWISISVVPANSWVNSLAYDGTQLLAGFQLGTVMRSTNLGLSWQYASNGLPLYQINSFLIAGKNILTAMSTSIIAGVDYSGGFVYLSTDSGKNWESIGGGSTGPVFSLIVKDSILIAGSNYGVWYRPLSEVLTKVKAGREHTPSSFSLLQNYPNPFNPSTVISYQLSVNSQVTLKVYDVLGREVTTLVNGRLTTGTHSVTFDAAALPSGVYFYRIQAGTYTATKKLLVLK